MDDVAHLPTGEPAPSCWSSRDPGNAKFRSKMRPMRPMRIRRTPWTSPLPGIAASPV